MKTKTFILKIEVALIRNRTKCFAASILESTVYAGWSSGENSGVRTGGGGGGGGGFRGQNPPIDD